MAIFPEAISSELKPFYTWTLWKKETRDGKPAKIPYQMDGTHAKSNNMSTWASFDLVWAKYNSGGFDGVCWMMPTEPYDIIFIDIDHCIKKGIIEPWAEAVIRGFNSYTERSQSGNGLHILIRGKKPINRCRKNGSPFEIYDCLRPCYLTGDVVDGHSTIEPRQEALDWLYQKIFAKEMGLEPARKEPAQRASPGYSSLADDALILKATMAKNGNAFRALWDGSTLGYNGDDSAADMAFMNMLAFWTRGNAVQMERIFSASGLGRREKWKDRADYRERTTSKAISDAREFYEPPERTAKQKGQQREIIITNRHMQDITAESLPELVAYNNPPKIFVKAGYLVQIAVDEKEITRIELLSESALKSSLSRCARYMRIAGEDGELAATDAPGKVVKDVLAQPSWPGILPIVGLISSPVVRPDGSIIDKPGHDGVTGLFYTGNVGMSLNVPNSPTQEEAVKAAAYIMAEVFGDFPFREPASRANTLAALLTTLTLPLICGNIPLGLFDKPQAGTGASLLTEIIAELVTGEKANMQTAPDNDEEWRKAITAVLIQGPQIVVIDNVTSTLKSSKMSQMLTARTWSDRMLGQTKMLNLPQTAAWFATGNNIQLGGDIARRAYWIRLDAASARPWLRDGFRHHDILAWVEEHRTELLSMLLVMIRAWIVAGQPKGNAPRLGSFVEWSRVIGGILTFAKVEGFLENAAELYDSADRDIAQWDLFLLEWQKLHRDDLITAAQLKTELTDFQSIYKPLQNEMPEEIIKVTDKTARGASVLGQVLRRRADQVFPSGRKLTVTQDKHTKSMKWSVIAVNCFCGGQKTHESRVGGTFAEDAEDGLTPSKNQEENMCIREREEKESRVDSSPASSAKVADDSETVFLCPPQNLAGEEQAARKDEPTPAKKVSATTKERVRIIKLGGYRTQIALHDNPRKYVDHLYACGEVVEQEHWKACDLIERGIAEAVQ